MAARRGGCAGLAVEINPTSNFLIGNLGEWRRHPLFRMNPPDGGGVNPVPLVVGSDDPMVFATGLPDEYQPWSGHSPTPVCPGQPPPAGSTRSGPTASSSGLRCRIHSPKSTLFRRTTPCWPTSATYLFNRAFGSHPCRMRRLISTRTAGRRILTLVA